MAEFHQVTQKGKFSNQPMIWFQKQKHFHIAFVLSLQCVLICGSDIVREYTQSAESN